MRYQIKRMTTLEDRDGKGYVHYQAWNEAYAGLIDQGYLERRTLEKCVANAHRWPENTLVAKDGDKVIGFVRYQVCGDSDLPLAGEVGAIYVLQEYYGQKVGFALMNAAMEQLAAYRQIVVWVLKGNERAIRFYERCGFCFDGAEKELLMGTPQRVRRMVYTRTSPQ